MPKNYNHIPEIIARLQLEVDAAVLAALGPVVDQAKSLVPVDTGRLRDAIHLDAQPEGVYVVAGDEKAWYGHIVEHGSVHSAAHPFLEPALEANREEIIRAVEEAVKRAIG